MQVRLHGGVSTNALGVLVSPFAVMCPRVLAVCPLVIIPARKIVFKQVLSFNIARNVTIVSSDQKLCSRYVRGQQCAKGSLSDISAHIYLHFLCIANKTCMIQINFYYYRLVNAEFTDDKSEYSVHCLLNRFSNTSLMVFGQVFFDCICVKRFLND